MDEVLLSNGMSHHNGCRFGTEHEKLAYNLSDNTRAGYDKIKPLLEGLCERYGWQPVMEGDNIIGAGLDGQSVSLEPGGQFELSGAPLNTLHATSAEVNSHLIQVPCPPLPAAARPHPIGDGPACIPGSTCSVRCASQLEAACTGEDHCSRAGCGLPGTGLRPQVARAGRAHDAQGEIQVRFRFASLLRLTCACQSWSIVMCFEEGLRELRQQGLRRIMRDYMPKRGSLGHDMMFRSTTIQARTPGRLRCAVLTLGFCACSTPDTNASRPCDRGLLPVHCGITCCTAYKIS